MLAMLMHTTSRENIPAFVDVGSQVLQRNNGTGSSSPGTVIVLRLF
jgi:hypothetical protein